MKAYDRRYFDRWYRDARRRVSTRDDLARKVALAISAAEYVLGRRVRSVLDVGCGEAPWRAELKRLRPGVRYLGIDGSEYVVARYGRERNIRLGRFGALERLGLDGRYDLVVCADVLHYVTDAEARRGLPILGRLVAGLAWIEVFTSRDDTVGDSVEYRARTPRTVARWLRDAGLEPIGLCCFVPHATLAELTAFERGVRGAE